MNCTWCAINRVQLAKELVEKATRSKQPRRANPLRKASVNRLLCLYLSVRGRHYKVCHTEHTSIIIYTVFSCIPTQSCDLFLLPDWNTTMVASGKCVLAMCRLWLEFVGVS